MRLLIKIFITLALMVPYAVSAQNSAVVDYESPKTYTIKKIKVEGTNYLSADRVIGLTGLQEGEKIEIPSQQLSGIVNRL